MVSDDFFADYSFAFKHPPALTMKFNPISQSGCYVQDSNNFKNIQRIAAVAAKNIEQNLFCVEILFANGELKNKLTETYCSALPLATAA